MEQTKNKRRIGGSYEELAAAWLAEQGFEILARNYRIRSGEIDLIAREGGYLVFVEVKYRSGYGQGDPAAAVDARKQRSICRVAVQYMIKNHLPDNTPCRFDVVTITPGGLRLYRDAFPYCL